MAKIITKKPQKPIKQEETTQQKSAKNEEQKEGEKTLQEQQQIITRESALTAILKLSKNVALDILRDIKKEKTLYHKADKISDLKENVELVVDRVPHTVDSFAAFYAAYKIDSAAQGYSVGARDLYTQATNEADKETLKEWFNVSQSLEKLEEKGLIKPQEIEGIGFKGALGILQQAIENLTQAFDKEENQEDEEQEDQQQRQGR